MIIDLSDFTMQQLKSRAAWLEKAAAVREGKPRDSLLAQKDQVLKEIAARNSGEDK